MAIILKKEGNANVTTPPAGSGAIFISDIDDSITIKSSTGNISSILTFTADTNTEVFFNDAGELGQSNTFTFDKTGGNLTVSGIKTDNYYDANGNPLDFERPAGNTTEIQFNNNDDFGSSPNLTFDSGNNLLVVQGTVSANLLDGTLVTQNQPNITSVGTLSSLTVTGNVSAGNVTATAVTGTLTTNAQPNVTSVGTLDSLDVTGNVSAGNVSGTLLTGTLTTSAQPNVTSVGTLDSLNVTGGIDTTSDLSVGGNAVISGNLVVNGNLTYVNVEEFIVEDPIISLGGGPNGNPLTSDDGKDRGLLLHYYDTATVDAFMGWDHSNTEFTFADSVSIANEVVSINTLGNARLHTVLGNVSGETATLIGELSGNTANFSGNVVLPNLTVNNELSVATANFSGNIIAPNLTVNNELVGNTANFSGNVVLPNLTVNNELSGNTANFSGELLGNTANFSGELSGNTANFSGSITSVDAALGNTVTANFFTGELTFAAQPNITSVGTLTSVQVGATANTSDFPNAVAIASQDNTGDTNSVLTGLVGEASADEATSNTLAVGLYGVGKTNGNVKATGVQGQALVTSTTDLAPAVGVRGYSIDTHVDGYNIGVLGNAMNSGVGNYAFYVQNGGIGSIETETFWDLADNSNAALTFHSTGKANIFGIETTDNAEGIFTTGYLNVTGNATVGGVVTDNYYYANGDPVDFEQPAGANNQIQFNDDNDFGASANLEFDPATNELSVTGTLNVSGNANVGNIGATDGVFTTVAGNLVTNAQPNITSVGTLDSLSVTGNVSAGNVSGTLLTGTLTTASQPNVTSIGTLDSLSVTGNIDGGNLSITGDVSGSSLTGTLTTNAQPNITSVGTLTSLDVTGNVSAGNVSATGISATTLGGTLTTNAQPNITSVGTLTSLDVTGNVSAGNVSATGISATTLGGTLTTASQPNVTSVGTLTSLDVTGNVSAGNLSTAGSLSVTGNASAGNVSATGISATTLGGSLTTAAQPNVTSVGTLASLSITGNVSAGNVSAANASFSGTGSFGGNLNMSNAHITNLANPIGIKDAANKEYVDEVAQGLRARTAAKVLTDSNLDATYNNGTDGVGATLTANTNVEFPTVDGITGLNVVATRVLVTGQTSALENGLYVLDQIGITGTQPWILRRCVECDTSDEIPGSFVFVKEGDTYAATGWVAIVELPFTIGTDDIDWIQFSGAGTFTAGAGLTLTGNEFSVDSAQPGITSVGTLTGLEVNGNIIGNTITANTGFVGNGSGLSSLTGANVTGQVANALVAGTVYTAAQPNITSVGTLTSLSVTGNASAGNISTSGTLSVTGNANVGNIGAGSGIFTSVSGNGSALTAINANNISTGTLSSDRLSGTYTITVSGSATTAGTVTTAAQPNITSVGTLSSLGVSGNITAANITANTGVFTGNGSGLSALNGSNITTGTVAAARVATLNQNTTGSAGTVTTAAQPNITSVGTLTSLAISGTNTLTVRTISTGANTTTGTITGNWSLSAGSKLNATYADLAECYTADRDYEPGTVVVFGGSAEVTDHGVEDDRAVAGVVSTNPAYLMNAECEGEYVVQLALIGRVPCKVIGPVSKGDLLVTSDQPGFAKVNNEARSGSIIGKSLENFDEEGEGLIEVLVGRC